MKKILSLTLVLCLLLSLGVSAAASYGTQSVNITYRAIKLVLDGKQFIPCDENGKTVEPFIMNSSGTTYLPLRALAQALGLSVGWDGKTSTVTLTSGGEAKTGSGDYTPSSGTENVSISYRDIKVVLDGARLELKNANGESVEPFIMNSTTYLPLRTIGEALGLSITWDNKTSTVAISQSETPDDGEWYISKSSATHSYTYGDYSRNENTVTSYHYDSKGNILEEYTDHGDGNYERTVYEYDTKGRVTYTMQTSRYMVWGDTQTYYYYHGNGNLRKMDIAVFSGYSDIDQTVDQAPDVDTSTYLYDTKGNILSLDHSSGSRERYSYDANGNLLEKKEFSASGDAVSTVYKYDSQNRVISERYEGRIVQRYSEYSYDARGNLKSETCETTNYSGTSISSWKYAYDSSNRLIEKSFSDSTGSGSLFTYTYDNAGNLTTEYYETSDGYYECSEYLYNADGTLAFEQYYDSDGRLTSTDYRYNKKGLIVSSSTFDDPYGTSSTEYSYDDHGNLVSKVIVSMSLDGSEYNETHIYYDYVFITK